MACGLAYWQWERYSSAGGSLQNLGYVLQWPLFGLFPAFVFWRIRRLSRTGQRPPSGADEGSRGPQREEAEPDRTATRRRVASSRSTRPTINRTTAVSGRPDTRGAAGAVAEEDAELAAYNRYLAELNARDQRND